MRQETVEYVHLPSGSNLPKPEFLHRRVIVIIEQVAEEAWRDRISDWIAASGCLYMMARGDDCSTWDDSVDHANLERFDYGDIPEESFIMTTWHDDEPLSEVFFHNQMCAFHPTIDLPLVTILHIAETDQSEQILRAYQTQRETMENEREAERAGLAQQVRKFLS
ncbi:DUF7684 family protein [Pontixanthobacter luteolus]|uniref:DUF7684 family protein n=1 Tax=Pontixanthobacter luteolus TaxID=295089 RepID=UPI002301FF57|nr:hypothetical protein [Pontixanthobacter luteolus]